MARDRRIDIDEPNGLDALKATGLGDLVYISGHIFTARDQAHVRLIEGLKQGKSPIDLSSAVIYYCGPTPAREGRPIGSCGPTTSSRMDRFMEILLKYGLRFCIGKGERDQKIVETMRRYEARYFIAPGGAGAYLATKVVSSRLVCYPDLGPEAVFSLEVRDFPIIRLI